MKSKEINTPADLIKGDYVLFVTWEMYKANAAKIEKVAVDNVFQPTHLNKFVYGLGDDGLEREWDPKKWIFQKRGAWDFRKCNWGDWFYYSGRTKQKLYRLDQLEEAERFAKVEVPKLQLEAVLSRIDKIRENFTSKMSEMEELEKILIENCNAVEKQIV